MERRKQIHLLLLLVLVELLSASLDAKLGDNVVGVELLLGVGGNARSLDNGDLDERQCDGLLGDRVAGNSGGGGVGLGVLALLASGDGVLDLLALLGGLGGVDLSPSLGQEHDLGAVQLEALHVGVEDSLGSVAAAVVDGDSVGAGGGERESGLLHLLQREATAQTGATVVHLSGALNNGAECASHGAGEDRGGLRLASGGTTSGAGGLVEPGAHVLIPVLAEMDVRDLIFKQRHPTNTLLVSKLTVFKKGPPPKYSLLRPLLRLRFCSSTYQRCCVSPCFES